MFFYSSHTPFSFQTCICADADSCSRFLYELDIYIAAFNEYFHRKGKNTFSVEKSREGNSFRLCLSFLNTDRQKKAELLQIAVALPAWILDSISNYEILKVDDDKFSLAGG